MRRNTSMPPNKQRVSQRPSLPVAKVRASSVDVGLSNQRPTKAIVGRAITNLVRFLEETVYPHPICARSMQSPNAKDVFYIFEHMLRHIDPSFRLPNTKMDEMCLCKLRDLGYPQASKMSKQYLSTPGAPHAWPTVLMALDWLREQVSDVLQLLETSNLYAYDDDQDVDQEPLGKVLHDFKLALFKANYNGQGFAPELIEPFMDRARLVFGISSTADYDQLKAELAVLEQKLLALDDCDAQIKKHSSQLKEVQKEFEHKQVINTRLKAQHQQLQSSLAEMKLEESRWIDTKTALEQKLSTIQRKIQEQEAAGYGRFVQRLGILRKRHEERLQVKVDLQRQIDEKELEITRGEGRIAPVLDIYNNLIGVLKASKYNGLAEGCQLKPYNCRAGLDMTADLSALLSDLDAFSMHLENKVLELKQHSIELDKENKDIIERRENLGLDALKIQRSDLQELLDKIKQMSASEDAEYEAFEQENMQREQILTNKCAELDEKTARNRARLSELQTTVDQQSADIARDSAYLKAYEQQATNLLPALRATYNAKKADQDVQQTRIDYLKNQVDNFIKNMEEKVKQALDDK